MNIKGYKSALIGKGVNNLQVIDVEKDPQEPRAYHLICTHRKEYRLYTPHMEELIKTGETTINVPRHIIGWNDFAGWRELKIKFTKIAL